MDLRGCSTAGPQITDRSLRQHQTSTLWRCKSQQKLLHKQQFLVRCQRSENGSSQHAKHVNVQDLPLPGGTLGLPVLGETWEFLNSNIDFYVSRYNKYGPIYKSHVLLYPTVFVGRDAEIRALLAAEHKLVESQWPDTMLALLGEGSPLAQQFGRHTKSRRVITQAFTQEAVWSYVPGMVDVVDSYVSRWVDKGEVSGFKEGKDMALDVAGAVLVGWRFNRQELREFRDKFETYVLGFFSLPWRFPWTTFGKAMEARDWLMDRVGGFLDQTLTSRSTTPSSSNGNGASKGAPRTAFDLLMGMTDEDGKELSREELKDQVLTQLFAGHETTATAIGNFLCLMPQHPQVMKKLRAEQAQLIRKYGPEITGEVLDHMPYADIVIKELLRRRPPVPMVYRRALEDIQVGEYKIPKDWRVMLLIGRSIREIPEWKNDVQEFKPERWVESTNGSGFTVKKDPKGYMPFGDGARVCIGMRVALAEMKVLLALMARKVEWELVNPDEDWIIGVGPAQGLKLKTRALTMDELMAASEEQPAAV